MIIPRENERDLKEVPENIKQDLDINAVKWIDEVPVHRVGKKHRSPLSDKEYLATPPQSGKESARRY